MQLILPSVEYKDSFIEAVKEYRAQEAAHTSPRETHYRKIDIDELDRHFDVYLSQQEDLSEGRNLPEGNAAETNYWLVDNHEFIGRVSIRHELNELLRKREGGHIGYDVRPSKRGQGYGKKILELALAKAKEMGIHRAVVTCDVNNAPSLKVIEANGGVLERAVKMGEGKPDKLRYWIDLK